MGVLLGLPFYSTPRRWPAMFAWPRPLPMTMMKSTFKADDPNLLGRLETSWRRYLTRMIKHCDTVMVPGLV
eukprot:12915915-Prorocentrum_lima.AAC.1